jgi:hypothetical protein
VNANDNGFATNPTQPPPTQSHKSAPPAMLDTTNASTRAPRLRPVKRFTKSPNNPPTIGATISWKKPAIRNAETANAPQAIPTNNTKPKRHQATSIETEPPLPHRGHNIPTAPGTKQSGQIAASQRVQRNRVSVFG